MIRVVVGFDQRESVAFHTFTQSIIEKVSQPVCIVPLALNALKGYSEVHTDGSNTFIYSRFLTPFLCDFAGWAIFADGDMICRADLGELWALRDEAKALLCVKHDYKTKAGEKYLGTGIRTTRARTGAVSCSGIAATQPTGSSRPHSCRTSPVPICTAFPG